jgi:hypothetical protein
MKGKIFLIFLCSFTELKKPPERLDFCDPAGTRTQGPNIKSVVLYQLSYEINR